MSKQTHALSRVASGLLAVVFALVLTINVAAGGRVHAAGNDDLFDGGDGSSGTPWQIHDCDQLQAVGTNTATLAGNYIVTADFSCTNTINWNTTGSGPGSYNQGFLPIGNYLDRFGGNFDGNHKTIDGLYEDYRSQFNIGLFGVIDESATVTNLNLTNVNITGGGDVGALAGGLLGHVEGINATGSVHGNYYSVGGLVGQHVEPDNLDNSSPLVFTWNGQKYDYVADVGDQLPKETSGVDLAQIDSNELVPKDGKYSMKIAQEYNEIVYYDQLSLETFDHAPGYNVVEPLNRTAGESDLRTVSETPTNPLQSCTDMYNHNCKSDLESNDDNWAYQDPSYDQCWTMNFGDLSASEHNNVQLLMRGARDYTKTPATKMRSVQVKDAEGNWHEIYNKNDLGSDATPRLRSIDLTNKFQSSDYSVKVCADTWQMNYFAIDTTAQVPYTEHVYHPSTAMLGYHGFTAIDRTHYPKHDYNQTSDQSAGILQSQFGNFTKYGDVNPLLQSSNDQFVVMRYGDQMSVDFPYNAPADGQERSFILNNDVFYKHANLGAIGRIADSPMPYHGMGTFDANTQYPMTDANKAYLAEWNTRHYDGSLTVLPSTVVNSTTNVEVTDDGCDAGGLVGSNRKPITGSHAYGTVSGTCSVGGVAGFSGSGTSENGDITNTISSGEVTSNGGGVGGLVGYGYNISITGSGADDETVDADGSYVGGLVGETDLVTISNSYSTVLGVSGGDRVGGLVGYDYGTNIDQSYSTSSVSGDSEIGGFVGHLNGDSVITNSYATGDATSDSDKVGGFVGISYSGSVSDSYALGDDISNDNTAGGFVGTVQGGNFERDYATGDVTLGGGNNGGGFVGQSSTADPGTTFNDNFASGFISGGTVLGGFAGDLNTTGMTFSNNHFDVTLTGQADCSGAGGAVTGCSGDNASGANYTLFRAAADHPVADWDLDATWSLNRDLNDGYPCLVWQDGCTSDPVDPAPPETSDPGTLLSAENGTPITLAQTGCTTLANSSVSREAVNAVQDAAYKYPVGFVGFHMTGCGASSHITLTFTGDFDPAKTILRKYNPTTQVYTTLTTANSSLALTKTTLQGKTALQATYTVTDNGPLDQDATTGAITDPVGIAELVVGAPNTGF